MSIANKSLNLVNSSLFDVNVMSDRLSCKEEGFFSLTEHSKPKKLKFHLEIELFDSVKNKNS